MSSVLSETGRVWNITCNAYLKEVFRFYCFLEIVQNNGSYLSVLSYNQPITKANAIGVRRTLRSRSFKGYLKEEERDVRAGSCVDEYSLGTFTKSLSRTDIGEISKRLPFYEEWRTEKFKEVKDQIKQEYQLGSKELTDALNLIKKHRLFSSNIGCERMFGTITEDELKEYASLVKYYWEKDKSKEKVVIAWDDLAEIQQNAKILKNYLSKISIETLNTLLCFYEIGNSIRFW